MRMPMLSTLVFEMYNTVWQKLDPKLGKKFFSFLTDPPTRSGNRIGRISRRFPLYLFPASNYTRSRSESS